MLPAFALPLFVAASLTASHGAAHAAGDAVVDPQHTAHVVLEARGARAQRMLAELLVDADAIDLLSADAHTLHFAVAHTGEAHDLIVRLGHTGRIQTIVLQRAPHGAPAVGTLSWLALAIGDREAVRTATVRNDGVVLLELDDGSRIPLTDEAGDDYVGC